MNTATILPFETPSVTSPSMDQHIVDAFTAIAEHYCGIVQDDPIVGARYVDDITAAAGAGAENTTVLISRKRILLDNDRDDHRVCFINVSDYHAAKFTHFATQVGIVLYNMLIALHATMPVLGDYYTKRVLYIPPKLPLNLNGFIRLIQHNMAQGHFEVVFDRSDATIQIYGVVDATFVLGKGEPDV